jgi:hypothetical protein
MVTIARSGASTFTSEHPDESLLEDRRGNLPAFPVDVLPPTLQEWLMRASRGAGTLPDMVAVPMLGVTSSLIGKARMVRPIPSWITPPSCWTAVVGESGYRKTPGLQVSQRALDLIEKKNAPDQRNAAAKHRIRVEQAETELKAWRKAYNIAKVKGTEPPPMPESLDIGDFIHPALYVSDVTGPRLPKLCNVRPRGMMVLRDELRGVFSMRIAGARETLLEGWNGNRHVVERNTDGKSYVCENLLFGIIGGFQPDRLRVFTGDEDGMSSRFLFSWPAVPPYAALSDEVAAVDPVYLRMLTQLIRLPAEVEAGHFAPQIVPLSGAVLDEFEDYRRYVDRFKHGVVGRERQWLAKSVVHVLRLAGTLAYLEWAAAARRSGLEAVTASLEPNEISFYAMRGAINLVQEYFWSHARASLRQIGLTDDLKSIRRALYWLRAHQKMETSRE